MPLLRNLAAGFALTLCVSVHGCSLGNVSQDDCESDAECTALFGLGSTCADGYCGATASCTTGHDCRAMFGGGACVDGSCSTKLPADPACPIVEPPDLFTTSLVGSDGPILVVGGIFSLDESADAALSSAALLAIREINRSGGGSGGQRMGIVICDNGGPGNTLEGDARQPLNDYAVDYLAGTLGVPYAVGPVSSVDAIFLINRIVQQRYPTVIISPASTSPQLGGSTDKLDQADPHGLFWRTCPSDELQGRVLIEQVIELDPAIQRIAVIYSQDAYGEGLAKVLGDVFGSTKTALFPFKTEVDIPAVTAQVVTSDPDAMVMISGKGADNVAFVSGLPGTPLATKRLFFTDGAKDASKLLDPALPIEVQDILKAARGTAPASPSGTIYELFRTNLLADFQVDAGSYGFVAQTYDAAYVGAYGVISAAAAGPGYDGRGVAAGLAMLVGGTAVNLLPTEWATGKGKLSAGEPINVVGTSGPLDFDPAVGDAPAPIEIWRVAADFSGFETEQLVNP